MQEIETAFCDTGDVEVQRLLDTFLSYWHLSLRAAGDVHGLLRMATAVDIWHALLRSQLRLLIAMLIVRGLSVEAAETTTLRREAGIARVTR
jgi:hypothetical protein